MDLYFADVFNIYPDILEEYGAFNISLINDLPLFIDPFLLFNSTRIEYQELHKQIIDYIRFLRDRAEEGDINDGLLKSWFTFPEIKQNWLGFSLTSNTGSGLGMNFARALYQNLGTILANFGNESITKDSHLEKLCLIKDGVGRDNISDFTTNLIQNYLLEYTQNFAQSYLSPSQRKLIPIHRASFNYSTRSWKTDHYDLPWYNDDYVILTPKDILTKDDTWINKSDLVTNFRDVVHSVTNTEIRAQINEYFMRLLPSDPKKREVSAAVGQVVTKYPKIIDFYIRYKEEHGIKAVTLSKQNVKNTEELFIQQLSEFVSQLDSETAFYSTNNDTYNETKSRVLFLMRIPAKSIGHSS